MQDDLQTQRRDLTVSKVAKELNTRRDGVLAFMRTGELLGYDVSLPGAKRKSYRITREALEDFKRRRRTGPEKSVASTKRKVLPPTVREHI